MENFSEKKNQGRILCSIRTYTRSVNHKHARNQIRVVINLETLPSRRYLGRFGSGRRERGVGGIMHLCANNGTC